MLCIFSPKVPLISVALLSNKRSQDCSLRNAWIHLHFACGLVFLETSLRRQVLAQPPLETYPYKEHKRAHFSSSLTNSGRFSVLTTARAMGLLPAQKLPIEVHLSVFISGSHGLPSGVLAWFLRRCCEASQITKSMWTRNHHFSSLFSSVFHASKFLQTKCS